MKFRSFEMIKDKCAKDKNVVGREGDTRRETFSVMPPSDIVSLDYVAICLKFQIQI